MAERFTPQTPDLEVVVQALPVVLNISLDKELYSTLSLFNWGYKWVLGTYCLGGNPAMD